MKNKKRPKWSKSTRVQNTGTEDGMSQHSRYENVIREFENKRNPMTTQFTNEEYILKRRSERISQSINKS